MNFFLVELVGRSSEAKIHLKPVVEQLRAWPQLDRPGPVSRIPTAIDRRLGRARVAELIYAYRADDALWRRHELSQ